MRSYVFLPSFLFLACMAQTAAAAEGETKGALDGEVFLVEKGELGKPSDGKDTYIFREFIEGAYKASQQGDIITFAADTESETQGRIHWEGTVGGDRIDVRYTWTGKKPKWYQSAPKPTEHWARLVTAWPTEDPGPPEGRSPSNLLDGPLEPPGRKNIHRKWRGKGEKRGRPS
jgi:hypothetical protein